MNTHTCTQAAVLALLFASAPAQSQLADPVRLEADGKVIDTVADIGHAGPLVRDWDGDGTPDLLVSSFKGSIRFFKNVGKPGAPSFKEGAPLEAAGAPIRIHNWWCVGISPQFADLDADGHLDIVSGCYEGVPYLLRGSKQGFAAPEHLRDQAGKLMHTGRYYDLEKKAHTSGDGPGARAYSALPHDWDGDGDFDLVVGTDKGAIYLRENEGSPKEPKFAVQVTEIRDTKGELLKVQDGYQMPVAADWDGDGLWDLISGSQSGSVYWFRNVGKAGRPHFEPAAVLVEKTRGLGGRSQVAVADFDQDGDLDLLVGDNHQGMKDGKPDFHGYVWFVERRTSTAKKSAQ